MTVPTQKAAPDHPIVELCALLRIAQDATAVVKWDYWIDDPRAARAVADLRSTLELYLGKGIEHYT